VKLEFETIVDLLESFTQQIKDGVIEVTQFDLRDGDVLVHQTCGIVDRCIGTDKIIEMRYKAMPPKKTQQEIYQELHNRHYEESLYSQLTTTDEDKKVANIYATKNTVKVWREQWKK